MIWEIEIRPGETDHDRLRTAREYDLLMHGSNGSNILQASSRGYLVEAELSNSEQRMKLLSLLGDDLVESIVSRKLGEVPAEVDPANLLTVLLKPGVMDPVSQSVLACSKDLGLDVKDVRTFRRYYLSPNSGVSRGHLNRILANDAIEQLVEGPLTLDHLGIGKPYEFRLINVPIRELDDDALAKLSRDGQLALNHAEMKAVQAHFREQGREPTDIELETIAQTWSEHCSHKTLKGPIDFTDASGHIRRIKNLLKETIFGATQELRSRFGTGDWCVSVFADNAGIVKFDEQFNVCFKVETHNHPSAIEP